MDRKDVLASHIESGIGTIVLGSAERIHFDPEMAECLFDTLKAWSNDDAVRVIVVTGGAPGYFLRHYSVPAIISLGEALQRSGASVPDDAPANFSALDHAMTLCETMGKPVIAAISGTCMGGAFEFALCCDIRIAQDGPHQIGLPEANLGILPGAGGTQRLPRVVGPSAALMHILLGVPLSPREAEHRGFVHETVGGKALTRAHEIAAKLVQLDPEALSRIKRLVRGALSMPLAEGLNLERNLFVQLAMSERALERMRAYEAGNVSFLPSD